MNILLIDNASNPKELQLPELQRLGLQYHVDIVSDTAQLLSTLQQEQTDVILFAIDCESVTGYHALEITHSLALKIPFIILCETGTEESIIDLMKGGADDYIMRSDSNRLFYSIRALINKFEFQREKQKLDQTIIESEKAYRLLAENLTDMITRHDLDGVYNYVSASSYSLLGYLPEELIGTSSFEYMHPEDRQRIKVEFAEFVSKAQGVYTASYRYLHQNGKYIWIESTNKFTINQQQEIDGIISTSRDISERKGFELKLEEKIRELDTFIYRSSHDLKGPLASLQGLINVAKTEIKDSISLQYFAMVERSVKHLDTLLMDLLNITRISQGSLNLVNINLAESIDATIKSFDHLPSYKEIEWQVEMDHKIEARLDKALLNNIIHNLIINSIKYSDKNKEKSFVKIGLKQRFNQVVMSIEDNGEGIPADLQKHVFEMFFRGNTKSSGTGLGLYIVKSAVEKMGGSVQLQSEVGVGSSFRIILPLNLQNENNDPIMKEAHNV